MTESDKFEYFMKRTEEDLKEIKDDIKKLVSFRMMLLGGSIVVSTIISTVILIIFGR